MPKREPPSKETIDRLSKPINRPTNRHARADDEQECTFKPRLANETLTLVASREPDFLKRRDVVVKAWQANRAKETPVDPAVYTFKPSMHASSVEVESGSAEFFARMEEDVKVRREMVAHNATLKLCPFEPQLHKPLVRGGFKTRKTTQKFLDRMLDDLSHRSEGEKHREQEAVARALAPCTFQPTVTKKHKDRDVGEPNFNSFLSRMEGDLEERIQRERFRNKLLSTKPKIV